MWNRIAFLWKLRRIEAYQRGVAKRYKADATKAKANGKTAAEITAIKDDEYHEWSFAEDEKADLQSAHLLQQANRLSVPLPAYDDTAAWEDGMASTRRLTATARWNLLREVRTERRERSELMRSWLPMAFAFLSAVAAWVAALRH